MTDTTKPAADTENLPAYGSPEWVARRARLDSEYEEEGRITLADCSIGYEPNPRASAGVTAGYLAADTCVVRAAGRAEPLMQDYSYECGGAGSRLELAWLILAPNRPAAWKTVAMLRTLRQAVRECHAQGMPLDFPPHGASKRSVTEFLSLARHFDAAHHGGATF